MRYAEGLEQLDITDLRVMFGRMEKAMDSLEDVVTDMNDNWPFDDVSEPAWYDAEQDLIALEELSSDFQGEVEALIEQCELIHDQGFDEDEQD